MMLSVVSRRHPPTVLSSVVAVQDFVHKIIHFRDFLAGQVWANISGPYAYHSISGVLTPVLASEQVGLQNLKAAAKKVAYRYEKIRTSNL